MGWTRALDEQTQGRRLHSGGSVGHLKGATFGPECNRKQLKVFFFLIKKKLFIFGHVGSSLPHSSFL